MERMVSSYQEKLDSVANDYQEKVDILEGRLVDKEMSSNGGGGGGGGKMNKGHGLYQSQGECSKR
jgi:hypothetical protein